jgi:hypothetical protein
VLKKKTPFFCVDFFFQENEVFVFWTVWLVRRPILLLLFHPSIMEHRSIDLSRYLFFLGGGLDGKD